MKVTVKIRDHCRRKTLQGQIGSDENCIIPRERREGKQPRERHSLPAAGLLFHWAMNRSVMKLRRKEGQSIETSRYNVFQCQELGQNEKFDCRYLQIWKKGGKKPESDF